MEEPTLYGKSRRTSVVGKSGTSSVALSSGDKDCVTTRAV